MGSFPFTLGVEIELPLVDQNGAVLSGDRLVSVWNAMFKGAQNAIKSAVTQAPSDVQRKVKGINVKSKNRHGKKIEYVCIQYDLDGRTIEIDSFGPDPNISQITWILELVTPPCKSPEELLWWISTLSKAARQNLPRDINIIPIGFLPSEKEYRSGVTFSNHIHIGIPDETQKYKIYNLLRIFVPHLIGMSVNSPFINEMPMGDVKIKDDRTSPILVISNNSPRSIRLLNNKGQLGPVDKDKYIPYLRSGSVSQLRKYFDQKVQRMEPDDRYCDVFPFTPYGTIEIRVFDCQPSALRIVGICCLVQMLAEKALKLGSIPEVKGESIVSNREKAVEYGLFGKFFEDESFNEPNFDKIYSYEYGTSKPIRKLFSGAQTLFLSLWPEMKARGFEKYLAPLFLTAFGNSTVAFPITPADYWLFVYQSKGQKWNAVEKILNEIFDKYWINTDGDPLVEAFGQADLSQFSPDEGVKQLDVTNIPESQQRQIDAARKKFDLPSSSAGGEGAPQIKLSGTLTIKNTKLGPDEELNFSAKIQASGPFSGKYIAILKLIEKDQNGENVLNSTMGTFNASQSISLSNSNLSLKFNVGAFKGTKHLIANLIIKDSKNTELLDLRSTQSIEVITLPDFRISPLSSLPKSIHPDSSISASFRFTNLHPNLKIKKYKVKILLLGANNEPIGGEDKEVSISNKPLDFPLQLKLDKKYRNIDFIKIKAQVLVGNKLIEEFLSDAIIIQKEDSPSAEKIKKEKEKPKVVVSNPKTESIVKPNSSGPSVKATIQPKIQVQNKSMQQSQSKTQSNKEKEKQLKERQEKERMEREKKEREKSERDKKERERQEKERMEREKKEREKSERDKKERERQEKERMEREKKEKELKEKQNREQQKNKEQIPEIKPKVNVQIPNQTTQSYTPKQQPSIPKPSPKPQSAQPTARIQSSTVSDSRPQTTSQKYAAPTQAIQKPRSILASGYTFEFSMKKKEAQLGGSHSASIRVQTPSDSKRALVLVIWYYAANNKKYYLKAKPFVSGASVKESFSMSLSKFPCGAEFCYLAEIYDQEKVVATDSSERITVIEKNIHKLISVSGNIGSNVAIPNTEIVAKFKIAMKNLPRPVDITFRSSIRSNMGIMSESECKITVGGMDAPSEIFHYYPISCGKFDESVGLKGILQIDAFFDETNAKLFSKAFPIQFRSSYNGLIYEISGYNESVISMNSLNFVITHIKNNTKMQYSGKVDVKFFHPNSGEYLIFNRKIKRIVAGNYEKEAERVYLPPLYGGTNFKVLSTASLKCKNDGLSFTFEALSKKDCKGDNSANKSLEVTFKGLLSEGVISTKIKMPLEIRAKLNSGIEYKDLKMVIWANYGNVQKDTIKTIKIKEARVIEPSDAVWNVKDFLGPVYIGADFYLNGKMVPKENTIVRGLTYFVFADKIREKM